jgi:DNA modification methylase
MEKDRFSCVVTSPPYYSQRDYRVAGQIGLETTIGNYVERIVDTFEEIKRVLAPGGTLFLNLGDTYYSGKGQPVGSDRKNGARRFGLRPVDASGLGVPRKTAIGIPWRVALAMIENGWTLRCPIVWLRNGTIPEPTAHDRPWRTYEMLFLFTKGPNYHFERANLRGEEDVWTVSNRPKHARGVHSAAFPDELVQRCLDVGCQAGGEVLDPFAGSGTVLRVAAKSGRPAVGIDLSREYCTHMVKCLSTL